MALESQIPAEDNIRVKKRDFEMIAWGSIFILWGITTWFDFISIGIGILGTGLILLGLNTARWLNGIPTRGSTTTLGILALVWGGLDLMRLLMHLPFSMPVIPILLVVFGGVLLVRELQHIRKSGLKKISKDV